MLVFTLRGVDEDHLHSRRLSGPLKLLQVGVVEPGCLHSLKTSRRRRVYPLTEVGELREQPGNVRTEPERSHRDLTVQVNGPAFTLGAAV